MADALYCPDCGAELEPFYDVAGYRCPVCEIVISWTPAADDRMRAELSKPRDNG